MDRGYEMDRERARSEVIGAKLGSDFAEADDVAPREEEEEEEEEDEGDIGDGISADRFGLAG